MYTKEQQLGTKKRKEFKRLVAECDALFSEFVRLRDGGSIFSGQQGLLDCHHMIGRAEWSSRWDPRNGVTLTREEHILGWHGRYPMIFRDKFFKKFPGHLKYYENNKRTIGSKPSISKIKRTISSLKGEIAKLN